MSENMSFEFVGGPIDDPVNETRIFTALGRAAASWARLEQQIETILLHINKKRFSEKLYSTHPVSFTQKLKKLKPWFEEHEALSSQKEFMLEIISKLWKLSEERNIYLHSILKSFDPQTDMALFLRILPQENDNFKIITHEVPVGNILIYCDIVNYTNTNLWEVSKSIFNLKVLSALEE